MAACCYPPAARVDQGSRALPRRDELGEPGRLRDNPPTRLTHSLPIAEAPAPPKKGPRPIVPLFGFALVLAIALVVNIILLGFASTRPVSSSYANKGFYEPAPAWSANGPDSADGQVRHGRACCRMVP